MTGSGVFYHELVACRLTASCLELAGVGRLTIFVCMVIFKAFILWKTSDMLDLA